MSRTDRPVALTNKAIMAERPLDHQADQPELTVILTHTRTNRILIWCDFVPEEVTEYLYRVTGEVTAEKTNKLVGITTPE